MKKIVEYRKLLNVDKTVDLKELKTIYETLEMYKKLKEYITSDFEVLEEYFYSSKEMLKDSNKVMRRNYIIMGLAALKYTILMDEELVKEYLKADNE